MPTHGRAKDGTQTKTVIGSPGGANVVPAHSVEFCPFPATCRQHLTSMGVRRFRKLVPCAKCGAMRRRNLRGEQSGRKVPLCGFCKAGALPGLAPKFLTRRAAA